MTDNSTAKRQAAYAAQLIEQGYTAEHAGKAARQAFPTPAQARMATARSVRTNGARKGAGTTAQTTPSTAVTTQAASVDGGYHTPEGRAAIAQASSRNNRARWARVRELGLRSLHDLAKWEAMQREQVSA